MRILLLPAFLEIEYRMPSFPPDRYGFTLQDRLHYGKLTMQYLTSNKTIDYFDTLKQADSAPLYNALELKHMTDVKSLISTALTLWKLALLTLLALAFLAWRRKWLPYYFSALSRGAWLTIIAIAGVTVLSLVTFEYFFDTFHHLLFKPGTWTFYEHDTFIRLFPERFWQDIFLWAAGIIIIQACSIIAYSRRIKK